MIHRRCLEIESRLRSGRRHWEDTKTLWNIIVLHKPVKLKSTPKGKRKNLFDSFELYGDPRRLQSSL